MRSLNVAGLRQLTCWWCNSWKTAASETDKDSRIIGPDVKIVNKGIRSQNRKHAIVIISHVTHVRKIKLQNQFMMWLPMQLPERSQCLIHWKTDCYTWPNTLHWQQNSNQLHTEKGLSINMVTVDIRGIPRVLLQVPYRGPKHPPPW